MPTQPNQINLVNLFRSIAGSLTAQKENLNNADTYNHDHGDNMVETFNMIAQAMQTKRNASPSDQLAHASQLLSQHKSGSAQLYAQGLAQASQEFKGQQRVTPENAINLIQALMGGGQASTAQSQSGMSDLLGSLLGGSRTTKETKPDWGQTSTAQPQNAVGDLLGSLLGGGNAPQPQPQNQQASNGLDAGDLLNAGMAFMNTKSQGGNNMQAIVNALVSGSAMGNSQHRSQSSALVINSLLQAISGYSRNK